MAPLLSTHVVLKYVGWLGFGWDAVELQNLNCDMWGGRTEAR